jgi:hypothetical protein
MKTLIVILCMKQTIKHAISAGAGLSVYLIVYLIVFAIKYPYVSSFQARKQDYL